MNRTIRPMLPVLLVGVVAATSAALTLGCDKTNPVTQPTPQTSTASAAPAPPPTPPAPAPTHTLTITASSSCTALPAVAMKRIYTVHLDEKSDGALVVLVVGTSEVMIGWANAPGFTGKRDGNGVRFELTADLYEADYALIERIPGLGDMGYVGTATGTIDSGRILATFDGRYQFGYGNAPAACQAPDHRMEMVPVGG